MSSRRQEALDYHAQGRPGKIQVSPTKPFKDQRDLSLAYTPGVAEPCLEIAKRPEDAYTYTAKGNLVAVVSNGTAVLGLGNIGPLAGKPVMEGKGILFKAFADIDVFDLEVGSEDPEDMIRFCRLLEQADGEMQADTAVVERLLTRTYPFSTLRAPANVLIFPNLDAANISYKLLSRVGVRRPSARFWWGWHSLCVCCSGAPT